MSQDQVVGLSLSFCVSAICRGDISIESVKKIVAATNAATPDAILDSYKSRYWSEFPDKAEQVVRQLWSEGRIEQPRQGGVIEGYPSHGHNIADGNWLDVKEGKQFRLGEAGSRVFSDSLGEGVDLILKRERTLDAKALMGSLGIDQKSGGRGTP